MGVRGGAVVARGTGSVGGGDLKMVVEGCDVILTCNTIPLRKVLANANAPSAGGPAVAAVAWMARRPANMFGSLILVVIG